MRFRLIDRITRLEPGRSIEALKAASFEEYQLGRQGGVDDALPGTLLVESLLQAGNWLVVASTGFTRMALVARIARVTLGRPVTRGERVRLMVRLLSVQPEGALLEGDGFVGDEQVIRGEGCVVPFVRLQDYEDPEDLKVLFEELAPGLEASCVPELCW